MKKIIKTIKDHCARNINLNMNMRFLKHITGLQILMNFSKHDQSYLIFSGIGNH